MRCLCPRNKYPDRVLVSAANLDLGTLPVSAMPYAVAPGALPRRMTSEYEVHWWGGEVSLLFICFVMCPVSQSYDTRLSYPAAIHVSVSNNTVQLAKHMCSARPSFLYPGGVTRQSSLAA